MESSGSTLRARHREVEILEAHDNTIVEINDTLGRTRLRFDPVDDSATFFIADCALRIRVSNGQLQLDCPLDMRFSSKGRIEFEAPDGVYMSSAKSRCNLTSDMIEVTADTVNVSADSVNLQGGVMKTQLERLALTVGKFEQFAGTVIQHARCIYQRVEMLLHTRADRVRTEATKSQLIQTGSFRLIADEDVRIQADSINLG